VNENIIPSFDKKIKLTKQQLTILNNIRNCSNIINFLTLKINKPTTQRNFAQYIRDYFIILNILDVNSYFKDVRVMKNKDKIKYSDKIENDILKFNKELNNKSGSYRLSNLSAIKRLFEYNKIELTNSFWVDVRKTGKKADRQTDIETLTPEQLKNVLNNADNEGKAFFLTIMTSGSRVDEIRTLTFDNLFFDTDPPSLRITQEHSKTGKPITKFITPEAKYWIEQYLQDRDKILETRINRARNQKTKDEYKNRVFPMGKSNPEIMWNNCLKKEGLYIVDPLTKHPKFGIHSLRRFFEDNIGNGKLSKYMQNKLSRSEEPYSYKTKQKLMDDYKEYMHNLYVFETTEETKKKFEEQQKKIEEQNKKIDELTNIIKITNIGRKSFENKFKEHDERFKKIEQNLKITLNPETPATKEFIESLIEMITQNMGKDLAKDFKERMFKLLVKMKKMDPKDILEIVTPENLKNNKIEEKINSY